MAVLQTDRLLLREFDDNDAPFVLQLLNDAAFLRFIGDRGVRTLEDARAYLQLGPIDSYRRFGHGLYLMEERASGAPVGMCGLLQRDYLDAPDLGFALAEPFRARGYTFEASRAVVEDAASRLGKRRLLAITSLDNVASIRLLEKLGFKWEQRFVRPPQNEELNLFVRAS